MPNTSPSRKENKRTLSFDGRPWSPTVQKMTFLGQPHRMRPPLTDRIYLRKYRSIFPSSIIFRHAHDDVIKWKHFLHYWLFVRGIHRSPVNSPHKGQWHEALNFSFICAWINGWVNKREAGDLRRHRAHYDVIIMRWHRNLKDKTPFILHSQQHRCWQHGDVKS